MSPEFSWDLPYVTDLFDTYIQSLPHATNKMDKSHVSSPYAASATTIAKALKERFNDPKITRHTVRHQIDKRKKWLNENGGIDIIHSQSKTPDSCSSPPSVSSAPSLAASESPKPEETTPVPKRQTRSRARRQNTPAKEPSRAPSASNSTSVSPTLNKENPNPPPERLNLNQNCPPPAHYPQLQQQQQPPQPLQPPVYPPNNGYPYQVIYQQQPPPSHYYINQFGQPIKPAYQIAAPAIPTEYSQSAMSQLQTYVANTGYGVPIVTTPQVIQPQPPNYVDSAPPVSTIDGGISNDNDTNDLERYYRLFL